MSVPSPAGYLFTAPLLALLGAGFCNAQSIDDPHELAAFIDQYCIVCHNPALATAGLDLDSLDPGQLYHDAEIWEKVIRKLRVRAMPPPGGQRPDETAYDSVVALLEQQIDLAAFADPNPGRTETFHRLNRFEYGSAIRDLLGLEVDINSLLPADNTFDAGFDNNGSLLSMSPALLDRYLLTARRLSQLATGMTPEGPSIEQYKVHLNLLQDDRMEAGLPFGSRGGLTVSHYFPVTGTYRLNIELQSQYNDYLRGMARAQLLEVRLNGDLLQQFSVGGEAVGPAAPEGYAGNIMMDAEWEYYMHHADDHLELEFVAAAGPQQLSVSFVRDLTETPGTLHPRQTSYALATEQRYYGNAAVDLIDVSGPFAVLGPGDTRSRQTIFTCYPEPGTNAETCARDILARIASSAYRHPVSESELETLLEFYRSGESDFERGIQLALERLLVDPAFLFRIEKDPLNAVPGQVYAVSDLELASRLSFFLWSSVPDQELLASAAAGNLSDPVELQQQMERMLRDPRVRESLVNNFAAQWLQLRNLADLLPDPEIFPEFDENLRQAFVEETRLFIGDTIEQDASVLELLRANYTYLNERLARHYEIPGVYGPRFRKVELPADHVRGGLLGQGSLLTVTSYPNRTSPVLRGKWVLQNLIGAPPSEPPPNVPALPDTGAEGQPVSVRERLEEHRKNPVCATCHAPMDPLGFALERFDAIGNWRYLSELGVQIDATGSLPNGVEFDGVEGLRDHLLNDEKQFAETVTEKMLAFALGRALQYYDRPGIRQIVRNAASEDYRWSALIREIVMSPAFQMRTAYAEVTTL